MPWKALPFSDQAHSSALIKQYGVSGIPCLAVLSPTGQVITFNGVQEIKSNGAKFIQQCAGVYQQKESITTSNEGQVIVRGKSQEKVKQVTPKQKAKDKTAKKVVDTDDEEIPPTTRNRRLKRKRSKKSLMICLCILCLAILLLVLLALLVVRKYLPKVRKTVITEEPKDDFQQITVKAIFSTDYILAQRNETANLTNIEDLTDQLSLKLTDSKIRITKASLRSYTMSRRYRKKLCGLPLLGNILHLHLVATSSDLCTDGDDECKARLREQLKASLSQLLNISINIEFEDGQSEAINIKFCNVTDIKEAAERKEITTTIATLHPTNMLESAQTVFRPVVPNDPLCILSPAKIMLVVLDGEQGTRIHDEKQNDKLLIDYDDRSYQSVTLFENSINLMRIRLNCTRNYHANSLEQDCSHAHYINVWIDFNDDGKFDKTENGVDFRSANNGDLSQGSYDLQISIPIIDESKVKAGSHRMRIQVIPSEAYTKTCGMSDYSEIREYTVNIIQNKTRADPIMVLPAVAPNPLCSLRPARIMYVHMLGERGTLIRDESRSDESVNDSETQNEISVTLYENTVNTLRIQLDCAEQSHNILLDDGCSLGYHIDVWIDLNDDGNFDDMENRVRHRSAIHDEMPQGTYDLQISIPSMSDREIKAGPHRMRIRLIPSSVYIKTCGASDYSETREYTVNIIQKETRPAPIIIPSLIPSRPPCSIRSARIMFVHMIGQHGTEIRDEIRTDSAIGYHQNLAHPTITLYESSVNILRIRLGCAEQSHHDSHQDDCSHGYSINVWIDLNDDGKFDEIESRILHRSLVQSRAMRGTYELEICIPAIETMSTNAGQHRMRLSLMASDQYRAECDSMDYTETREYKVNIIPKVICEVAAAIPPVKIRDFICSPHAGKINLVLIGGELGTQLRDESSRNIAIYDNRNQNHLSVTLFGNSLYYIRIHLDCSQQYEGAVFEANCNLAHYVNVWIDLNDDGKFDESENQVYHHSPINAETPGDIYDLEIFIPAIDDTIVKAGMHRMRLGVTRSEAYQRQCGNTNYVETREYMVKIIRRKVCGDTSNTADSESDVIINLSADFPRIAYCLPGNLVCSVGSTAISSVKLFGEQNTMIQDTMTRCSSIDNYDDRSHLAAKLLTNKLYKLEIELHCVEANDNNNVYEQEPLLVGTYCNTAHYVDVWIDLNNDGSFDENTERFFQDGQHDDGRMKRYYSIDISIPQTVYRNELEKSHRLRIILSRDQRNRQPCSNSGHGEARDYTIYTLPESNY